MCSIISCTYTTLNCVTVVPHHKGLRKLSVYLGSYYNGIRKHVVEQLSRYVKFKKNITCVQYWNLSSKDTSLVSEVPIASDFFLAQNRGFTVYVHV